MPSAVIRTNAQRSNPYNFRLLQSAQIAPGMHQNAPFSIQKSTNFPSPEPFPSDEGILSAPNHLGAFSASTFAPSALVRPPLPPADEW